MIRCFSIVYGIGICNELFFKKYDNIGNSNVLVIVACASALNTREGFKEGQTTRAGKKDTVRNQKSTTLYNVQEGKCVEMKKVEMKRVKSSAVPKGQGNRLCFTCDDWGTKCGPKKPKGCKKKSGFTQRGEPEKLDESKRDKSR